MVAGAMFTVIDRHPDAGASGASCANMTEPMACQQSPGTVGLEGTPLNGCCGEVELVGVHFAYPARPSRSVFRGLSMRFPPGKWDETARL